MNKKLAILQVNTLDMGGGAEQIADNLLKNYQASGHDAWLAVGEKRSSKPEILVIPVISDQGLWAKLCLSLREWLTPLHARIRGIARLRKNLLDLSIGPDVIPRWMGMEEFHYPGSKTILELAPKPVEIVHLHNLHGHYFDLRTLTELSQKVPVVITMHDAWLLSGNCAHSFACEKWKTGCGACPDISIYPGLSRDTTALNWKRKQGIYAHSHLYLATPSQWLMNKAQESMLLPAIMQSKVIPNGVDLNIFHPANQALVRSQLRIAPDAQVLLFAANGIKRNKFKDYATIRKALELLSNNTNSPVLVIALGEEGEEEVFGSITIRYVAPVSDRQRVAAYYQAADIYIHASHVDTFPTSILEAMACGLPVVATAVGGIPEQVDHDITGLLVPAGASVEMAQAIETILNNSQLRTDMGKAAAIKAQNEFSLALQAQRYLDWYQEILASKVSTL
jgi:glycosyltransferase involved in cell wall biosynthesis